MRRTMLLNFTILGNQLCISMHHFFSRSFPLRKFQLKMKENFEKEINILFMVCINIQTVVMHFQKKVYEKI